MKKFLISIDTEGDNLWGWKHGEDIHTENAKFLYRFQNLCEEYGFKPTYLTNYEMATDSVFISFAKNTIKKHTCEIGMHLHAWNSPPFYDLPFRTDVDKPKHPYLIEYPEEIMEQKISFITSILTDTFELTPITHRAGRWATNSIYFKLLEEYKYKFDCSVTPGMSWEKALGQTPNSKGSNYIDAPQKPYNINGTTLIEIPVTVRNNHRIVATETVNLRTTLSKYYHALKGHGKVWLRPNGKNLEDMLYLTKKIASSKDDYLMFMLHSSELMPNGSWTFKTAEDIEKLYADLNILFKEISKNYVGKTIGEYGLSLKCK